MALTGDTCNSSHFGSAYLLLRALLACLSHSRFILTSQVAVELVGVMQARRVSPVPLDLAAAGLATTVVRRVSFRACSFIVMLLFSCSHAASMCNGPRHLDHLNVLVARDRGRLLTALRATLRRSRRAQLAARRFTRSRKIQILRRAALLGNQRRTQCAAGIVLHDARPERVKLCTLQRGRYGSHLLRVARIFLTMLLEVVIFGLIAQVAVVRMRHLVKLGVVVHTTLGLPSRLADHLR